MVSQSHSSSSSIAQTSTGLTQTGTSLSHAHPPTIALSDIERNILSTLDPSSTPAVASIAKSCESVIVGGGSRSVAHSQGPNTLAIIIDSQHPPCELHQLHLHSVAVDRSCERVLSTEPDRLSGLRGEVNKEMGFPLIVRSHSDRHLQGMRRGVPPSPLRYTTAVSAGQVIIGTASMGGHASSYKPSMAHRPTFAHDLTDHMRLYAEGLVSNASEQVRRKGGGGGGQRGENTTMKRVYNKGATQRGAEMGVRQSQTARKNENSKRHNTNNGRNRMSNSVNLSRSNSSNALGVDGAIIEHGPQFSFSASHSHMGNYPPFPLNDAYLHPGMVLVPVPRGGSPMTTPIPPSLIAKSSLPSVLNMGIDVAHSSSSRDTTMSNDRCGVPNGSNVSIMSGAPQARQTDTSCPPPSLLHLIRKPDPYITLTREMVHYAEECHQPAMFARKQAVMRKLTRIIGDERCMSRRFELVMTGSSATKFGSDDKADLDTTIVMDEQWYSPHSIRRTFARHNWCYPWQNDAQYRADALYMLKLVYDALCHDPWSTAGTVDFVSSARMPVIKLFVDGVHVDVTYHCVYAVRNTHLLAQYGQLLPHLRPLVLAVKRWARSNELNVERNQCRLTSYSLTLMVIFYLQHGSSPPLLHALRDSGMDGRVPTLEAMIDDMRHLRKGGTTESVNRMAMGAPYTVSKGASLGELFVSFLHFYANFDFAHESINVFMGKATPRRDLLPGVPIDAQPPIFVQEPFTFHNTAYAVYYKLNFEHVVLATFRQSSSMAMAGGQNLGMIRMMDLGLLRKFTTHGPPTESSLNSSRSSADGLAGSDAFNYSKTTSNASANTTDDLSSGTVTATTTLPRVRQPLKIVQPPPSPITALTARSSRSSHRDDVKRQRSISMCVPSAGNSNEEHKPRDVEDIDVTDTLAVAEAIVQQKRRSSLLGVATLLSSRSDAMSEGAEDSVRRSSFVINNMPRRGTMGNRQRSSYSSMVTKAALVPKMTPKQNKVAAAVPKPTQSIEDTPCSPSSSGTSIELTLVVVDSA